MAVKIQLNSGVEFVVYSMSVEELREAVRKALDENLLLEVENGNGKKRIVNPLQIVYFEEEDSEDDIAARLARAET